MSKGQPTELDRFIEDLEQILGLIEFGTVDRIRRLRRIDLAFDRMAEYRSEQMVSGDGERGGTSSTSSADDVKEATSLDHQITRDALLLHRILGLIGELPAARAAVARYVDLIDLSELPTKAPRDVIPGCLSCVRSERRGHTRIGGHFAPVYEKAKKHGLCRFCYDVRAATGQLPPIEICDVYHSQGPRQAGRLIAKRSAA